MSKSNERRVIAQGPVMTESAVKDAEPEKGRPQPQTIPFSNEQIDATCQLIDIAVKAAGLQVAHAALAMVQHLQQHRAK